MAIVDKQSSVSKVVEEGKVRFTFSQYRERERERETCEYESKDQGR